MLYRFETYQSLILVWRIRDSKLEPAGVIEPGWMFSFNP